MKKIISVLLALAMLTGIVGLTASAAGGKSITLPFVYMKDELGNDTLQYTAAVKCNGDHIPMPEDPDPTDGIPPVKPECTEHPTVIFCKHGDDSANPDVDYTISYDMSKYGAPDENGEITGIDEAFFEFTVEMDDKFIQKVTVTANGAVITANESTGRYVLPMDYSYLLEIPTPDAGYPNFDLRRIKVTFPATNTKEGYNLYSFTRNQIVNVDGDYVDPDPAAIYERHNGVYGQDFYVKLLVQDGYRECLTTVDTSVDDFNQEEYPLLVKVFASTVPNSPLPPLDAADQVYHEANIYQHRARNEVYYVYDFFDNEEDNVPENDDSYILCGRVYRVDGEVMTANSVEMMVQGITADQTNTIFTWLFRIFRMIINLFKNFFSGF